jgi:hypothetical protein
MVDLVKENKFLFDPVGHTRDGIFQAEGTTYVESGEGPSSCVQRTPRVLELIIS